MPMVTNVSKRVIHAGDTMLVPGTPAEVPEEIVGGAVFKALLKAGDVKKGEHAVEAEVADPDPDGDGVVGDKPQPVPKAAQPQPPVKR